jgi:hypothetical protein
MQRLMPIFDRKVRRAPVARAWIFAHCFLVEHVAPRGYFFIINQHILARNPIPTCSRSSRAAAVLSRLRIRAGSFIHSLLKFIIIITVGGGETYAKKGSHSLVRYINLLNGLSECRIVTRGHIDSGVVGLPVSCACEGLLQCQSSTRRVKEI